MTFNSKIQLGFLASAVALVFAAPTAFANGDRTMRNILIDPGSTSGAPAAIRAEQVMKRKAATSGVHTDPGGTPDAPAAIHTEQVMQKKSASVAPDLGKTVVGLHTDPGGTPDAPAAVHTEHVMKKQSGSLGTVVPLSKPAY